MTVQKQDTHHRHSTGFLLILAGVFIVTSTAFFLMPDRWLVWAILAVSAVTSLAAWHNRSFDYLCKQCGAKFAISLQRNLLSPHVPTENGGEKYLRCPACSTKDWAQIVEKR